MNLKQSNFYEVLDALGVNAFAGKNSFQITNGIKVNNDRVRVNLKAKGHKIIETKKSTFAIMSIGDLGLVMVAKEGRLSAIFILDFSHKDVVGYLKSKDYRGMLTHLTLIDTSDWILEKITC